MSGGSSGCLGRMKGAEFCFVSKSLSRVQFDLFMEQRSHLVLRFLALDGVRVHILFLDWQMSQGGIYSNICQRCNKNT